MSIAVKFDVEPPSRAALANINLERLSRLSFRASALVENQEAFSLSEPSGEWKIAAVANCSALAL